MSFQACGICPEGGKGKPWCEDYSRAEQQRIKEYVSQAVGYPGVIDGVQDCELIEDFMVACEHGDQAKSDYGTDLDSDELVRLCYDNYYYCYYCCYWYDKYGNKFLWCY